MRRIWSSAVLFYAVLFFMVGMIGFSSPVFASLNDDRYDGNIFALYGGNGSLIPPRVSLAQSINDLKRPALLVFYVDDSSDCKLFTPLLNQVQAFYGKVVSIIPVIVDSFNLDQNLDDNLEPNNPNLNSEITSNPNQPEFYYKGFVPYTVLINTNYEVVFEQEGKPSFETLEIPIRKTLGLTPKVTIPQRDVKVRQINEVNP